MRWKKRRTARKASTMTKPDRAAGVRTHESASKSKHDTAVEVSGQVPTSADDAMRRITRDLLRVASASVGWLGDRSPIGESFPVARAEFHLDVDDG